MDENDNSNNNSSNENSKMGFFSPSFSNDKDALNIKNALARSRAEMSNNRRGKSRKKEDEGSEKKESDLPEKDGLDKKDGLEKKDAEKKDGDKKEDSKEESKGGLGGLKDSLLGGGKKKIFGLSASKLLLIKIAIAGVLGFLVIFGFVVVFAIIVSCFSIFEIGVNNSDNLDYSVLQVDPDKDVDEILDELNNTGTEETQTTDDNIENSDSENENNTSETEENTDEEQNKNDENNNSHPEIEKPGNNNNNKNNNRQPRSVPVTK